MRPGRQSRREPAARAVDAEPAPAALAAPTAPAATRWRMTPIASPTAITSGGNTKPCRIDGRSCSESAENVSSADTTTAATSEPATPDCQ